MTDDSEAAFRRPPTSGRFKKGKSGNPKGRPKGTRNLQTDLTSLMKKRVPIRQDGEQRFVSRQELMLLKLFEQAAKGDSRASTQIFNMLMKFEPKEPPNREIEAITESDRQVVADFLRRNSSKPE